MESLIGQVAEVRKALEPSGMVYVNGELWNAVSESGQVGYGEKVIVVGQDGLRLRVAECKPKK